MKNYENFILTKVDWNGLIFDGVVVNGTDCYVFGDKYKNGYKRCYKVDNAHNKVLENNLTIEFVRKSLTNNCTKIVAIKISKGE